MSTASLVPASATLRPTPFAIAVAACGFTVAAIPVLVPGLWPLWPSFWSLLAIAFAVDAALTPRRNGIGVALEIPDELHVGAANPPVALIRVTAAVPAALQAELLADLSDELAPQQPQTQRVGRTPSAFAVSLVTRRRGVAVIERIWLRFTGPLGLCASIVQVDASREAPILPNILPLRSVALRFFGDRHSRVGLKVEKFQGDGTDFESLKEWVRGDDVRAIDWKPTAKHNKLVVRQFRAERNHQVILAVDTGRLMSESFGGVPKLDHALNAALVLSWVCLKTGDRVGFHSFDGKPRARLDPVGGTRSFPLLQRLAARAEYSEEETNFTLGLTTLAGDLKRRSLVVVLTDFVDSVTAERMVENVGRLAKRHLMMFVALRDPRLRGVMARSPESVLDVGRAVVGSGLSRERDVVLRRLRRLGVLTIDAEPAQIGAGLVNRYLDVKRRELL